MSTVLCVVEEHNGNLYVRSYQRHGRRVHLLAYVGGPRQLMLDAISLRDFFVKPGREVTS